MLLFILFGVNGATIAQTTEQQGKKVSHIGRWVGFFMVYSGYEFSDQFNLEKLAGPIAGELLQDASFNPELIYMLDQFQQDHFLTIYPVPVYNGPDKAVINRLNEVSLQFHDPRNDPYLNLFIYLDTLSGRQFKLSLAFHSPVDQIGLPEINAAANQRLQGVVFNTMQESTAKTNEVIAWALGEIAKKAGDTFHPPFYVQYKDNVYRNGNIIEVWQDERTEFQAFKKINGSYQSTYSGWRGEYLTGNGAYAWYEPTEPGQLPIMVIHETDTLRLQVLAKAGTGVPDLKEIVRSLLKEALAAKRQQLQGSLDSLRNDSTSIETTLGQQIARLEKGNVAMEDDGGQMKMLFDQPVVIEDSALFKRSAEREKGFELIRKRKNVFNQIISKVNIEAFIDLAVDDPEKLKLLTDDLLSNSGTLLAQLLVGKDNQGDRAQAMDIVFRYVNQNIERLANAQPMSLPAYAIRPIVVPAVEEITPDYSKRLYINENVVFEGKEQFVKEIEDYLSTLETPTIVTINYSQDENSEGYVSRAKAGRPKGLPEGYDYISIVLVNIPGSVMWNMIANSSIPSRQLETEKSHNIKETLNSTIRERSLLMETMAFFSDTEYYHRFIEQFRKAYITNSTFEFSAPKNLRPSYGTLKLFTDEKDKIKIWRFGYNDVNNIMVKAEKIIPREWPDNKNVLLYKFNVIEGAYFEIAVYKNDQRVFEDYLFPKSESDRMNQITNNAINKLVADISNSEAIYILAALAPEDYFHISNNQRLNAIRALYKSSINSLGFNHISEEELLLSLYSKIPSQWLTAEWCFQFFEEILKKEAVITEIESICINYLLRLIKDGNQAEIILSKIKSKKYDKKLVKTLSNFKSISFSNVANGLSWLYYTQNKNKILESGKNVSAENFYIWEPFGNVREKYSAYLDDPSYSTFIDWYKNTRMYSYSVHNQNDGRLRIHAVGIATGLRTSHYDFYIEPLETVSVYFASKNKYVNIEDYTVVMPGILFAWIIDQGEREANQMMLELGITAASFYLGGAAIIKASGQMGKIFNAILFVKGFSDILILSKNREIVDLLGEDFISKYSDLINIIDCVLIFKEFADDEIASKISLLLRSWNGINDRNKMDLKDKHPNVFNYLQTEIEKLN